MNRVAPAVACAVCTAPSGEPVYRYDGPSSISSVARIVQAPTIVHVCQSCGHVQTQPLDGVAAYYDTAYNVHGESDDADDLYAVRDGVPVYRAQHQAEVALAKLALPHGATVLDYGCGKGMTLRALLAARPDVDGAVFDVSDAYRAAWDAFVPRDNQAAYTPPASWAGRFDAVLSFFALEHAADPRGFLAGVRALLRPGGTLHLTVPNVRRNPGDFIVVDHVNHFMPSSLRRLLADAKFTGVRIDEESHHTAYVVDARRAHGSPHEPFAEASDDSARYVAEARELARFWSGASESIAKFERETARGRKSAIYGSGFYGVFIAGGLADRSKLAYFLDRNPHQQAKRIFGRPVIAPEAIEDDVKVVYAGLNPANAHAVIASVPAVFRAQRDFYYLDISLS
ncbi:MAG TPA: methyltransferase domain-containing protein [Candidatus Elarobacter sp.]|jgi:SAM-dependent methyltransferase|nr:methyltransferase domain-containing protein [Candidatus Elarobacter sp.]